MMKCVNEEDEVCKKGKIEKNGLGEKNEKEREKNEIIQIVKCILNIKATSSMMISIPFQIYFLYQITRK